MTATAFDITDTEGLQRALTWIRRYRRRHHITQAQVAQEMGCSPSTVSQIETCKVDFRMHTLQSYLRAIMHLASLRSRIYMAKDDED